MSRVTCSDGTVVIFDGRGGSRIDQEATESNKQARQDSRDTADQLDAVRDRLDAIEANHG
ncbi:MAG TPA: hypothetical protein VKG38_04190 [Solirubrobacteraceae bacterium]|nr:hypothetical protein [Solirubrobacteraceae bacterium]